MDIKFNYFPGKSLQVLNKGWFFELPKSNGKNLTFNTFVMHRSTVFQEIQEEIFDCFSKISMFEKEVYYVFYPSQYFLDFIFVISYFASPRADSAGL